MNVDENLKREILCKYPSFNKNREMLKKLYYELNNHRSKHFETKFKQTINKLKNSLVEKEFKKKTFIIGTPSNRENTIVNSLLTKIRNLLENKIIGLIPKKNLELFYEDGVNFYSYINYYFFYKIIKLKNNIYQKKNNSIF